MNGEPLRQKVLITNPHGLHMPPCAAFVEAAGRFRSNVTLSLDGLLAEISEVATL